MYNRCKHLYSKDIYCCHCRNYWTCLDPINTTQREMWNRLHLHFTLYQNPRKNSPSLPCLIQYSLYLLVYLLRITYLLLYLPLPTPRLLSQRCILWPPPIDVAPNFRGSLQSRTPFSSCVWVGRPETTTIMLITTTSPTGLRQSFPDHSRKFHRRHEGRQWILGFLSHNWKSRGHTDRRGSRRGRVGRRGVGGWVSDEGGMRALETSLLWRDIWQRVECGGPFCHKYCQPRVPTCLLDQ